MYKSFILSACLFLLACNNNPMGVDDPVSVYLTQTKSGCTVKVYCDNQMVSFMNVAGENDTISVPNGSELKARIYDGKFKQKTITAKNNLVWELP